MRHQDTHHGYGACLFYKQKNLWEKGRNSDIMSKQISKMEADILMEEEKYIETAIKWIDDPNKENFYEFRVPLKVKNNPYVNLVLKGSTNTALNRHTFAIIYNRSARIKALDIGKIHPNKCPNHTLEVVGTKHKHTWQDCCKDGWAYVPDDITDDAPLEQVFQEFLKECNIKYEGTLPRLPDSQLELIPDELFDD